MQKVWMVLGAFGTAIYVATECVSTLPAFYMNRRGSSARLGIDKYSQNIAGTLSLSNTINAQAVLLRLCCSFWIMRICVKHCMKRRL